MYITTPFFKFVYKSFYHSVIMAFALTAGQTTILAFVLIIGFCVWKFLIQPIENEGKPIEPSEEDFEESVLGQVGLE